MADSMMENPKPGDLLEGQTNIVSWLRKFERAARAADVFEILTKQEEVISKKPVKTDYIKIKPTTRAQAKKTIAAADEAAASASETETSKDAFAEYKIDMEEYKENRKKVLKARGLLSRWVTDIIATEMEEELSDPQDPVAAFAYIKDTYKVSEAFVRKEILTKVTTLKLDNFESMAAYWNQHRQFKVDLIKAGYKAYGDDEMATNILAGLPAGYRNFVNHYEFDQLKKGEDSHDTKFLFKALLAEEVKVKAWKEEKKDREREKNTNKKSTYKGQENAKPDRQGSESATTNTANKDNLKCDHCGKSRHTAERCWTLHPELVPKGLKERFDSGKADTKINKSNGFSGLATTEVDRFNNALAEAGKGSTKPPGPHGEPTADHCAQTSRTGSGDGDSWASGIEPGCCGEGEDGTARCEGQDALTALAVGSFSSTDTWLIDSGCNMHITNNKKWYTTFHALDLQIATADGQTSLQILGGGSVQLNLFTSRNKRTPITLHNVAYAPNARCNLISLSQLLEEGQISSQKADGTGMTLLAGQETVGEAKKEDGLYYARVEKEVRVDKPFAAAVDYKDAVMIWHRRLGHLGFQNMRNLLKASTGMDITDEQIRAKIKTVCPICAITRGTVKVPRDPAKRHAQEPGRLMHVDTWGPYPIEGWDGTTRFLFITDDATRMTWSARVPRKRMLSAIFKRLHKKIQRTHGFSTRMYRLDGEFSRGPIGRWIESKGMTLEDTAPYEHYQNGVAERANRIIREKAAPMIQEATITKRITKIITEESIALMRSCELPENLWPEAIEHAVWLKNRSPARALRKREKKTPWEAMFDDKPTLSRERIWGSRAYVTLPHEKTTFTPKLHSPRAWPGYFVGCASESTYRIYSAEKGKVFKVGVARIEDGQGLDEPQDEPSLNARITPVDVDFEYLEENEDIAPSGSQGDSSDEEDEENSQHGGSEHTGEDQEDQLFLNSPEGQHSHSDTSMRNERMESERSPERLPSDIRGNRNPSSQERDAIAREHARREHVRRSRERSDGSDGEDEEYLDTSETSGVEYNEVSKYFAGMGKVGKRPLRYSNAGTPNDALDTSDKESDISEMSSTDEEEKITKKKAKRGVPIRRFADDTKCNRCFRGRLRCDRSEVGVPCTQCKEGKRPCYDQTPETRKLITPDSERPGNNPGKQKMEDKCDVCLKDGSKCVRTSGEPKCVRCKNKRRTCIDAKPETISAILDEKAQKKAKKEEKKEKKCHRCVRYGLACNGQRPCDNCPSSRTAPFCMSTREWDEYNKTAQPHDCTACQTYRRVCDRKLPCSKCKEYTGAGGGRGGCYYVNESGLEGMGLDASAVREGVVLEPRAKYKTTPKDKCVRCLRLGLNCDAGGPCYNCVTRRQKGPQEEIRYCSYEDENRLRVRYTTQTHEVNADESEEGSAVVPRPDWQSRRPQQRASTSEIMRGLQGSDESQQEFRSTFPNGPRIMPTPSNGLLCGLEAIRASLRRQHRRLPEATMKELLDCFQEHLGNDDVLDMTLAAGYGFNNLSEDQIAAILQIWGVRRGLNLHLGYILGDIAPGMRLVTVVAPDVQNAERRFVWIHNDNASAAVPGAMNHWSGLEDRWRGNQSIPRNLGQDSTDSDRDAEGSTDSDDEMDSDSGDSEATDADVGEFGKNDTKSNDQCPAKRIKRTAMVAEFGTEQLPDPQSYAEAMRAPDAKEFQSAMGREQDSLEKNHVYEVVALPEGARAITSRWVYKRKLDHHGKIKTYKARLVARGFQQQEGIDYTETFAAVVKPPSYRIFFALAAEFGYIIHQMDVKTAFLNGTLQYVVYMKPPPGMKVSRGHVLKLLRSLYGLNQAPRAWYDKFRLTMQGKGWRVSSYDPCVFVHDSKELLLCLWVDDILIAGKNEEQIRDCKKQLAEEFEMTDEGLCSYYLGMHVEQTESSIAVHQAQYVNQMLRRYDLQNITPAKTPLRKDVKLRKETEVIADPVFKTEYQSKVGSLNFLSNGTRPDISFAVGYVARFASNPNQEHLDAVHHIFAYVAGTRKLGLNFRKQSPQDDVKNLVKRFVDSDFANCEDSRRSTTGFVFVMSGAPISWSSKRQATVAQSTMEAEYFAASEAARDAVWTRNFMNDLKLPGISINAVPLYIDNNCALKLSRNPEFHARAKHIEAKHHYIREKTMETKEIDTMRVDTKEFGRHSDEVAQSCRAYWPS